MDGKSVLECKGDGMEIWGMGRRWDSFSILVGNCEVKFEFLGIGKSRELGGGGGEGSKSRCHMKQGLPWKLER